MKAMSKDTVCEAGSLAILALSASNNWLRKALEISCCKTSEAVRCKGHAFN